MDARSPRTTRRADYRFCTAVTLIKPEHARDCTYRRADAPRAILEEIVASHGIRVAEGPGGMLLLIRERACAASDGDRTYRQPARRGNRRHRKPLRVGPSAAGVTDAPERRRAAYSRRMSATIRCGRSRVCPAQSASDLSAKINVRGGVADEMLVRFDGLRLAEPISFEGLPERLQRHQSGAGRRCRHLHRRLPGKFRRSHERRHRYSSSARGRDTLAVSWPQVSTTRQDSQRAATIAAAAIGLSRRGAGTWIACSTGAAWISESPTVLRTCMRISVTGSATPCRSRPTCCASTTTSSWLTATWRSRRAPATATATSGCDSTRIRMSRLSAQHLWRARIWKARAAVRPSSPASRAARWMIAGNSLSSRCRRTGRGVRGDAAVVQIGGEWRRSAGSYHYRDEAQFDLMFDIAGSLGEERSCARAGRSPARRAPRRLCLQSVRRSPHRSRWKVARVGIVRRSVRMAPTGARASALCIV